MVQRSIFFVTLVGLAWLDVVPSCKPKEPPWANYPPETKADEAPAELARIHDATAAYFQAEQQCPNDGQLRGEAGITPPLSINCNQGFGRTCHAVRGSNSEGYYDPALWEENPVWKALGYSHQSDHWFHYNFIWANNPEGHACMFTIQAFADLDDDGVFSTYERYGAGDVTGVQAAEGIYIVNELE